MSSSSYEHRYSVAPMMGVTDRHYRYCARLLTRRTLLYTEMVVDNTLVYNPNTLETFLGRSAVEEPVALQLGGNDPESLARAAELACEFTDYAEVNLNCGCPSTTVATKHEFGARMMLDPEKTKQCVAALVRRVGHKCPVTVKHRLGTDIGGADYATTAGFVRTVREAGCRHFVVHARMAILGYKVSCAKNRSVPPLQPTVAHLLARDFSDCTFAINGGLLSIDQCSGHLDADWASEEDVLPRVHSAMVGRSAWYNPWDVLGQADTSLYGCSRDPALSRRQVIDDYLDYVDRTRPFIEDHKNHAENHLLRPLYYLFAGETNVKAFRTYIADECTKRSKHVDGQKPLSEVARDALVQAGISDAALDRPLGEKPPALASRADRRKTELEIFLHARQAAPTKKQYSPSDENDDDATVGTDDHAAAATTTTNDHAAAADDDTGPD